MIELQACHRVFALSRRDQDRERMFLLPRLFALPRWPLPPLWGSWTSTESPFGLRSHPSCSACALMLRSQPRILVPLGVLKWAPALPWLQWRVKRGSFRIFELGPALCGVIFLGARFRLVSCPQPGSGRIALMKFTLLNDSLRWTLSFPNFCVVPRALGEFDGVI